MSDNKYLPPKGFRDIQPGDSLVRRKIINLASELALSFGFLPIETPTVEYKSVLMNKYGQEADKLIFDFQDRGGRWLALRYDQTVPLARYINRFRPKLPFKRYQIQPEFRAENPQKGRYREFTQIDFDIVGDSSFVSDVEILLLSALFFEKLGLNVIFYYNSRQLLYQMFATAGVPKPACSRTAQIIDKIDKIPATKVKQELNEKAGLKPEIISSLWRLLSQAKANQNMAKIIDLVGQLTKIKFEFSPFLVRGLDYYTDLIFEARFADSQSSLAGGGRYDQLIKQANQYLPAVGIAFGLDRIAEAIKVKNPPPEIIDIVVLVLDYGLFDYAFKVARFLRGQKKKVYLYPQTDKVLKKGLKYALSAGAKEVVFIGPDEKNGNYLTLKNLRTQKQKKLKLNQ